MNKEKILDCLFYLIEHANKCNDCSSVNIGCDFCDANNTMECDIAYHRLITLIEKYFELEKDFKILEKNYDELYDFVHYPKPYKFEDLKPDMWLWDNVEKKCNKIIDINENNEIGFYYITESVSRYIVKFEENRFYPITKAICEVNER